MSRNKLGATQALGLFAITLAASNASAATGDVAFGIRPSYNNVPDLANPGAFDSDVVVYSLPASGSIYSGPRQSYFDVFARVDGGGTQQAAGFGSIVITSGGGELIFVPDPIDPSGESNNIPNSKNPDFIHNALITQSLFGEVDVQNFPDGSRSVGVIGLYQSPIDVTVSHGDGLFAMPIEVAAGFQGQIALTFPQQDNLVSFVKTNGVVVTNTSRFPHQGATVEVRAAVQGDFNGDLLVNAQDWPGFNAARSNFSAFQSQYPWLPALYAGDFNEDGAITALDVPAFQQLAGVPEPSTIALAVAAAMPLLLMRRRRSISC
jgi:hypothetical protein